MQASDYQQLYDLGDILRHLRDARWRLNKMVEQGKQLNQLQLDKVDTALNALRDTFRDLELVSQQDRR